MKLSLVSKRYPNNSNINNTNTTATTKREKDVAVAVNFKKLKEEGGEKMQAVRERMVKLDLKEEFVEKLLKEYPVEKIEGKLDLLMERKNIKNPAGWLRAALKNDYRGEEEESYPTPHPHLNPPPSRGREKRIDSRFRGNDIKGRGDDKCRGVLQYALPQNVIANDRRECGNPKHVNLDSQIPSTLEGNCRGRIHPTRLEPDKNILSTEDARRRFHFLREQLMAMDSP